MPTGRDGPIPPPSCCACTLVRGDGLILTGVIAANSALPWLISCSSARPSASSRTLPLCEGRRPVPPGHGTLLAWLAWQFGSPLPATLSAKRARRAGHHGFYAAPSTPGAVDPRPRPLAQSLSTSCSPAILVGLLRLKRALGCGWSPPGGSSPGRVRPAGVTPTTVLCTPPACAGRPLRLGIVESGHWPGAWPELALAPGAAGTAGHLVCGFWLQGWFCSGLAFFWPVLPSPKAMVRALDGPVPPPRIHQQSAAGSQGPSTVRQGMAARSHPAGSLLGVTEVG